MIHDVHALFKDRLRKIIYPVYGEDIGIFQLAADAARDGEDVMDTIARHMCLALVEKKDHERGDQTGSDRDHQGHGPDDSPAG